MSPSTFLFSSTMPLYAADVSLGKPRKIASTDAAPAADKPKRQMSEETKAKLREGRERRKQERAVAALRAQAEAEEARRAEEEAEALALAKKQAIAQRRKEARERKKREAADAAKLKEPTPPPPPPKRTRKRKAPLEPTPDASTSDGTPPPKKAAGGTPKQVTCQHDPDGERPPHWFTRFVTSIMTEKKEQEGLKPSRKELREAGEHVAENKWNEPLTRERIRNAMDGHLGDMYSMIFG